jgi:arsenate reductase
MTTSALTKVYQYDGCSTCKKALKFLEAKKVKFEKLPIVEKPPTVAELKKMAAYVGDFRKLFNTSGQLYREFGMSEKLKTMTEAQAIELLAKHGKLVKRPFVLGRDFGMVGFKEPEWKKVF